MSITQISESSASEAAIFSRVFVEGPRGLTPERARHILTLEFSDRDKARMHGLAVKNQEGGASTEELRDLDNYVKVADLVAILQSKSAQAPPSQGHFRQAMHRELDGVRQCAPLRIEVLAGLGGDRSGLASANAGGVRGRCRRLFRCVRGSDERSLDAQLYRPLQFPPFRSTVALNVRVPI